MKALVVDDDRVLADLVAFALRREGFEVLKAYDGLQALKTWEEQKPDLLILDVNLPNPSSWVDGFEICRRVRVVDDVPIILLTVRGEEEDIVNGLQLGADDYILKPFSPRQLVARIQAVLRRAGKARPASLLQVGDLTFDPNNREVVIRELPATNLTYLEARLLEYLILHTGHYLSYSDLISHVWGPEQASREMLRQLIKRLRMKIEPDPGPPAYLANLPGMGYGIFPPPDKPK